MARAPRLLLVALVAAGPVGLAAQGSDALYARFDALSGWEIRGYNFDPGLSVKSVSQWNVPIVFVAPLGSRLSFDLTTHYTNARIETYGGGGTQSLSGLTDTQLRFLYTASRDHLVGTLSLNLPTGPHSVSTSDFQVAGAIGATYLSFPVANFGTAFGATGGLAYAERAGEWNLGLSGSLRWLGNYTPFSNDSLSYKPGLEGRVRAGADRLLGTQSRVLLGLTVSTFSTDVYAGSSSIVPGWYTPGTRLIGDLGLVRVMGRSTVTLLAWDYYRLAGQSNAGSLLETKENVLNGELRLTYPVSPRVQLEPMVGFRQWSPANYRGGRLYSGGLLTRLGLTDRLSATAAGRYDSGWILAAGRGFATLTGYGASMFLRYEH
jgi:hypothetical protein